MNGKNSPRKVTLAMMKGKPIACSVPVIHYHANNDELEEIYSSAEDESSSKDSPTSSSKATDKKLDHPGGDAPESISDGRTAGTEGNLSEGTPPSSDPWKVFSEIKGKLTKTFEEKFSEIKSEKRKKSPSPKDHSSRSDSEDFTDLTPTDNQKPGIEKQPFESTGTNVRRRTLPVSYVGFSRVKTGLKDKGFHDEDVENVENVENVESGVEASEFSQDASDSVNILRLDNLRNSPSRTRACDNQNDSIFSQQRSQIPYNRSSSSSSTVTLKTVLLHLLKQIVCEVTLRFVTLLAAAFFFYFFAPLPDYIVGFVMGLLTTITFWSVVTIVKQILTTMPEDSLPNPAISVLEIPAVEEHAVVERFHGWLNVLPYAYEPDNYHVARTKSVFFRLEGNILHIMETRTKIPKRAVWDEPRHKLKFTKRRILNLNGAKVELLPNGLARRRRWSKKYPICITFQKGALRKSTKKLTSHNIKDDDDEEQKVKRKEEGKNDDASKNDNHNDDDNGIEEEYEEYEELEDEYEDFDEEFEELEEEYEEDGDDEEYEDDEDDEYGDDEDEFEEDENEKEEDKEKNRSLHDNGDVDKKEEKLVPEEDEKKLEIRIKDEKDKKTEKKEDEEKDKEEGKVQGKTKDKKEETVTRLKGLKDCRCRKNNEEGKNEKKMYIFARADREKEDWYRRLLLAASGVSSRNQDSVPKDKLSGSASPSATGIQNIPTEPKVSVSGNNSSDCAYELSYKAYMRKYLENNSAMETVPSAIIEDTLWLNCLLARLIFDIHNCPETINLIQHKIQRKLSNIKLPYFMECLIVSEVRIGQEAPTIRSITKPINNERGFWFDLNLTYKGCFTMTVETKLNLMKLTRTGSISTTPDMFGTDKPKPLVTRSPIFYSDIEDSPETSTEDEDTGSKMPDYSNTNKDATPVQSSGKKFLSMVDKIAANKYFQHATELPYVRRAMEGVSNKGIRFMVTVSSVEGCLSLNIPPAPSDRLWYGFKTVPRITLTVTPAVGERTVNIVSVTKWIETKLLREFEKLVVLPNMDDLVLPLCPNYPYST